MLTITGMHCASCKELIEDVCADIPGVTSCDVDVAEETATIEHDGTVSFETVKRAIEELGDYHVEMRS